MFFIDQLLVVISQFRLDKEEENENHNIVPFFFFESQMSPNWGSAEYL